LLLRPKKDTIMLDRYAIKIIKVPVLVMARALCRLGVTANQVTVLGFLMGALSAGLIAYGAFTWGLGALLASRLLDALDGAIARQTQATDAGGFLDIALDFLFYAMVPLAFAVADPVHNALPAAVLLATFIGTGSSFLAFAALAAKRGLHNTALPDKSFYFMGGLTEATETIAVFAAMCWWPHWFPSLAYFFASLCLVTIMSRIWWGWTALKDHGATPSP
jgi:phosphatidylglycerophosphate synthase